MKVIRIEHWRCGEPDEAEYYLAPDELSGEEIEKLIKTAEDHYNNLLAEFKKLEPRDTTNYWNIDSVPNENITIKEARELHKKQREAEAERSKKHIEMTGSFGESLAKYGIRNIREIEFPEDLDFSVSWGHRHGETLRYKSAKSVKVKKKDEDE